MSRVLALVGAVLLIAAAILARAVLDDDDEGDDGGSALVVACIPELADACEAIDRAIELTIEDPADTIERLAAGEAIDAWVTLDPWPEMAAIVEDRVRLDEVVAVASSDLVLLARTTEVPEGCDPVTWTCLVDGLGDRVEVPDPDSALGRLVVAFAANDFHPGFAANELRDDVALQDRLAALGIDAGGVPPEVDMLVLPDPDATGTTAASFDTNVASRPAGSGFTSHATSPAAVAVVVAGPDADRITGEPSFTAALEDLGWALDAGAATTGLPNAGVLVALQGAVG